MPVTLDLFPRHDTSNSRARKFITITGPASYATGGESLTPASIGMGRIDLFNAEAGLAAATTSIRLCRYNYTTQKLQWFGENFSEIGSTTDLSTYTARVEVVGL